MRVLVTGGRDIKGTAARTAVRTALEALPAGEHVLVASKARGAARIAAAIARTLGWQVETHTADGARPCDEQCRHGRRPQNSGGDWCPTARDLCNQEMVDAGADVVIAFLAKGARNSVARDCIRRARAADLPVKPIQVDAP